MKLQPNPALLMRRVVRARRPSAFTLVELLLVVAILGILAAIVVPQFVSAASEARTNTIKMDLHRIRTQLEIYRQQHNGSPPTLAKFTEQMTMASDRTGATAALGTAGYYCGPYLREIPINPNTANNTVTNGAAGTSAWYFDETNGDFRANDSAESRTF